MNFKYILKKLIFLIFFCFITLEINAQNDNLKIVLKTNPQEQSIQLRWAAASPDLWSKTNQSGFILERYTVKRNGILLKVPEKVLLSNAPIKAQPMNNWEKIAQENDMAAMIAQALFGEKMELTGADAKGMMQIINQSREMEQRYMFAMYAADLNFEAACMAGWGWTDKTALKEEEYLYRVLPADSLLAKTVKEGASYTSIKFQEELPNPPSLAAVWGDMSVQFSWNASLLNAYYVAYYIEKSVDGKTFYRISDIPIINMTDKNTIYYQDTLASNDTTYYYRLRGVSSFGEIGPVSEAISGSGKTILQAIPHITNTVVNKQGNVEISWDFDKESNDLLLGFELRKSTTDNGTYQTVISGISPENRNLVYTELEPVNYFTIAAVPVHGAAKVSLPVLVQPVDSVPPVAPTGLKGSIDSLGVVTLTWNANTDKDLFGYRIFRSFIPTDDKMQLNDLAHFATQFTDTVQLKNLNAKVYYSVAALDYHYNQSQLSETIILKKPDVIPPTSSVISGFKSTKEGIRLQWINSSSDDLAKNRIYRSEGKDSMKILTEITDKLKTEYVDGNTEYGKTYQYAIKAVDESELESALSPIISIRAITETQLNISFTAEKQQNLTAVVLKWKIKPETDLQEIQVYRKQDNQVMSLWKTLSPWEKSVVDDMVLVGAEYEYMIKIIPKNGNPVYGERIKRKIEF